MFVAPTEVVTVTSSPALEGTRRQAARSSDLLPIPHIDSAIEVFREFPRAHKIDGWVGAPQSEGCVYPYLDSKIEVAHVDRPRGAHINILCTGQAIPWSGAPV